MTRSLRAALLFAALAVTADGAAAQDAKYKTYQEAYAAGAKAVREGNLAAAREPLEAAAKLATTDRDKLEAHRALLIPYRELQEVEPMQSAAEFIIAATTTKPAERSLTRSAVLSFVQKRGKIDAAVTGYEDRLAKDPDDRTALYLLAEAYATYKKDPARAADRGSRLAAAEKKAGRPEDAAELARLAAQYVKAERLKEGAELYERLAPNDPKLEAWHLKEAAAAWLKAGEKAKAVAAARKSAAAAPEARPGGLTYFWRRGLGDVFLEAGEPKEAVPQYEQALTATKLDGYIKDTKAKLAQARSAAGM
jgi:hypothetical protein